MTEGADGAPLARARLLYDSVSRNTGDIAIGIAAAQVFSSLGVGTEIVDPFSPRDDGRFVVAGGELIRRAGDTFYDAYRPRGPHILNAAGVWTDADELDYLRDYEFVSARSETEAEVLRTAVPSAIAVPCATTLLESPRFEIPGLEPGEPVLGIHLVPHALRLIEDLVPIINAIPMRKVFIPFTHYNADRSFMMTLPFDRSDAIVLDRLAPLELHSVIGQMHSVLVTSLHATIFAYSQNVPFASIHQKKVDYYFRDRGLADHLVRDGGGLQRAAERLVAAEDDYRPLVDADRARVLEAFGQYARILGESIEPTDDPVRPATGPLDAILLAQAEYVIQDRDAALAYSESRRIAIADERAGLLARLERSEEEARRYRNLPWRRAGRQVARAWRHWFPRGERAGLG